MADITRHHSPSSPQRTGVFISYARSDGEAFAQALRERLKAEGIEAWLDRVGLEGGRDWWEQAKAALDKSEFLVLVLSPRWNPRTCKRNGAMPDRKAFVFARSKSRAKLISAICRAVFVMHTATTSSEIGSGSSTI